jgi:hypothetical protein
MYPKIRQHSFIFLCKESEFSLGSSNEILQQIIFEKFIMKNIGDIIDDLGGEQVVAMHCRVHQTTVSGWIIKNSIPQWHWKKLIEMGNGALSSEDIFNASQPEK